MAQRIINLGLTPNDGNGDPIRVGGQKINENFSEIFPLLNNKVRVKMIIPDALSGNGTIKQQTLEYLNSLNPYEVKRDEILIYKLPIFSGTQSMLASDNYLFTSHHYFHKVGAGIFGQGATQLNSNDITDPIISQEASDIVDLGNVNNNISVVVNNSGPYRERVFKGSRSGIDFLYMYVGDEELIGQGAAQTVENDFVDLMNQNINLDSYLTNLDLFDRYTYLQFDNEGSISGLTEEYYLVRLRDSEKYYFITNEGDFLYTKILLKGLGAVDTGDVTTRDVIPGYDMYELLLPSGIGSPQALLEEGHKYWFTFWRYFGSSGSTFTGIETTNTDDIELSGNGTTATPLEAELTQGVKDEIQKGVTAESWGDHADAGYLTQHQDISGKEDKANKVTNLSNPNNTTYPTTLAIINAILELNPIPEAPVDGKIYGRKDEDWEEVPQSGGGGIPDAPNDNMHARKENSWVDIEDLIVRTNPNHNATPANSSGDTTSYNTSFSYIANSATNKFKSNTVNGFLLTGKSGSSNWRMQILLGSDGRMYYRAGVSSGSMIDNEEEIAFLSDIKNKVHVLNSNTQLGNIHHNDTLILNNITLTVNPTSANFIEGFSVSGVNDHASGSTTITLTASSGWTYRVNGETPINSGNITLKNGGTFTMVRKGNTNRMILNGDFITAS